MITVLKKKITDFEEEIKRLKNIPFRTVIDDGSLQTAEWGLSTAVNELYYRQQELDNEKR